MPDSKFKEKEREARLKALREELEAQIETDLRAASLRGGNLGESHPESFARHPERSSAQDRLREGSRDPSAALRPQDDVPPKRILEALLFATAKPLTIEEIKKVGADLRVRPESEGPTHRSAPTHKQIETWIQELKEEYARENRSFELLEIAGGYEIVTRKEYAPWLARLELQRKARQASRSALETLAILAYKQPVTRAEIEELRGVDISGVLSTLLERGFIKIVGKKEVAGRPFLYGTTEKFLEHFGLKSIQDLPPIGEIKSLVERVVKREELIGTSGHSEAREPNDGAEESQDPSSPAMDSTAGSSG